ncbi:MULTISPECIES: YlzJ-like family protein [Gracilibacillus]|nr:YlzJ-like family protein [Gracilibacillus dipsosauri]
MHYTPLSYEDMYPVEVSEHQKYQCITYKNKQCLMEKLDNGDMRLVQLLSTDPNDFLLAEFSPGSIIKGNSIIS